MMTNAQKESRKGAALVWAIMFGVVIVALTTLLTTMIMSSRVSNKNLQREVQQDAALDQIGEYFFRCIGYGGTFPTGSEADTKEAYSSVETFGWMSDDCIDFFRSMKNKYGYSYEYDFQEKQMGILAGYQVDYYIHRLIVKRGDTVVLNIAIKEDINYEEKNLLIFLNTSNPESTFSVLEWSKQDTMGTKDDFTQPTEGLLKRIWKKIVSIVSGLTISDRQYRVAFYPHGGNLTIETKYYNEGTGITLPSNITKAGSRFIGWSPTNNKSNIITSETYTVTKDVILHAMWQDYTVTLNANGGTLSTKEGPVETLEYSGTIESLPEPTPSAELTAQKMEFDCWTTEPDGEGLPYLAGKKFSPTENCTLYAKWKEITTYSVTFSNGGDDTVTCDEINDDFFAAQDVNVGTVFTMPKGNLWKKAAEEEIIENGYRIDFVTGYDSVTVDSIYVNKKISVNYIFDKWAYKDENGAEHTLSSNTVTIDRDYDFYPTYKVGETSYEGVDQYGKTTYILLPTPSAVQGMKFDKWYYDEYFTLNPSQSTYHITTSDDVITLYAKWNAGTYTFRVSAETGGQIQIVGSEVSSDNVANVPNTATFAVDSSDNTILVLSYNDGSGTVKKFKATSLNEDYRFMGFTPASGKITDIAAPDSDAATVTAKFTNAYTCKISATASTVNVQYKDKNASEYKDRMTGGYIPADSVVKVVLNQSFDYGTNTFSISGVDKYYKDEACTNEITAVNDGTYYFTMPKNNVEITAKSVEVKKQLYFSGDGTTVTVKIQKPEQTSWTSINNNTAVAVHSKVEVTVNHSCGTDKNVLKFENVSEYYSDEACKTKTTSQASGTYYFYMPSKSTTITASCGYTLTTVLTDSQVELYDASNDTSIASGNKVKSGLVVKFVLTQQEKNKSFSLKYGSTNVQVYTDRGCSSKASSVSSLASGTYYFKMPESDTVLTASSTGYQVFTSCTNSAIEMAAKSTIVGLGDDYETVTSGSFVKSSTTAQPVWVRFKITYNYSINSFSISGATIYKSDSSLSSTVNASDVKAGTYYYFKMPTSDVTLTATSNAYKLYKTMTNCSISFRKKGSNGFSEVSSGSQVPGGTWIKMKITYDNDINSIDIDGLTLYTQEPTYSTNTPHGDAITDASKVNGGQDYFFRMPSDRDVTITGKSYLYTVSTSATESSIELQRMGTSYYVSLSSGGGVKAGTWVRFKPSYNHPDYSLSTDGVTCYTSASTAGTPVTDFAPGVYYYFQMPLKNVKITSNSVGYTLSYSATTSSITLYQKSGSTWNTITSGTEIKSGTVVKVVLAHFYDKSTSFAVNSATYYTNEACTSSTNSTAAGTYYFKMPKSNTTVSASSTGYTVSKSESNSTVSLYAKNANGVWTEITSNAQFKSGTVIKMVVAHSYKYDLKISVSYATYFKDDACTTSTDSTASGTYYFKMPKSDTTVTASSSNVVKYRIYTSATGGTITVTDTNGNPITEAEANTWVKVVISFNNGKTFNGFTSSASLTYYKSTNARNTNKATPSASNTTFYFKMPARDVTLTLTTKVKTYKITLKTTNASLAVKKNGTPLTGDALNSIEPGTQLTVTVSYTKSKKKTITFNPNVTTTQSGSTYTFTMPSQDLTITASSSK